MTVSTRLVWIAERTSGTCSETPVAPVSAYSCGRITSSRHCHGCAVRRSLGTRIWRVESMRGEPVLPKPSSSKPCPWNAAVRSGRSASRARMSPAPLAKMPGIWNARMGRWICPRPTAVIAAPSRRSSADLADDFGFVALNATGVPANGELSVRAAAQLAVRRVVHAHPGGARRGERREREHALRAGGRRHEEESDQ